MISAKNEMRQPVLGLLRNSRPSSVENVIGTGTPDARPADLSHSRCIAAGRLTAGPYEQQAGEGGRPAPQLSGQRIVETGERVSHDCHGGGIFPKIGWQNFVQRVRSCVMVMKIGSPILHNAERRNCCL